MRKKIYFQNSFGDLGDKEFVFNGSKTTFGVFTKEFKERRIEESDILKKQFAYIKEQLNKKDFYDRFRTRYHSYTDFDFEKQFRWNVYKTALLCLALREVMNILNLATFSKLLCKSSRLIRYCSIRVV